MAFGFFKKTQAADIIFYNGHIYTHDPDFPWAEAVACTDGKISAVGDFDAMDSFKGKHTEIFNLDGKFVFPGFIDIHRSPVMKVFEGKYLDLRGCPDVEELCSRVTDWAASHPDQEIIFGYGFLEHMDPQPEMLDKCCSDRPVVLLAESGIGCAVNHAAEQIIQETAEEECVEIVTVNYVLNLLMPFDFEQIEAAVEQTMAELASQGITTVLNQQTPDYFESLYQDSMVALYNEGKLRQRFFGSYLLNRPLQPRGLIYQLNRRKTNCSELSGMVQANMLNVYLHDANCPMEFPQEAIDQILLEVADKGFHFFIEAKDRADVLKAYEALEVIRGKGYKNAITIASDVKLTEEDMSHLERCGDVYTTWMSDLKASHPAAAKCQTAEEVLDEMTLHAAAACGMEKSLGTIEKGHQADFAVFAENPLEKTPEDFAAMKAVMTVIDGQIVSEE